MSINIECTFKAKIIRKTKTFFEYEETKDRNTNNTELVFKYDYFYILIDHAISSMRERFTQFTWFKDNLAFYITLEN